MDEIERNEYCPQSNMLDLMRSIRYKFCKLTVCIATESSMLSFTVPLGIRKLADRFKSLSTGRLISHSNLCALFCLFLFGCKTLSQTARQCPWTNCVSDLADAVKGFKGNRFMRRLRLSIIRRYKGQLNAEDFEIAVDDTANPKYGKGIFRSGRWHDGRSHFNGQKVLVIALIDRKRDIALPIAYTFARKESDPEHKTLPDLAIDLIRECVEDGLPKMPVVADSWFDSAKFMMDIEQLGLTFGGEIKANRLVRGNPGKHVRWQHLVPFFNGKERVSVAARPNGPLKGRKRKRGRPSCKYISETFIQIKGRTAPLKAIAVYNDRNSKDAFAYYVSTDRQMSGSKLWALSRSRWAIEVLFRDQKQFLSFGRIPCGGEAAADLAVCMPFAITVSLRLDPPDTWELSDRSSIGMMVMKIREVSNQKAIDILVHNSAHNSVKRFATRRSMERINRKPATEPAA